MSDEQVCQFIRFPSGLVINRSKIVAVSAPFVDREGVTAITVILAHEPHMLNLVDKRDLNAMSRFVIRESETLEP